MSTLLKDRYNKEFYNSFCVVAEKCILNFNTSEFQKLIFDKDWESKELKDRMAHTASCLYPFLNQFYSKAMEELVRLSKAILNSDLKDKGFECMFIPAYIEQYGLENYKESVEAMEEITKLSSCEFAVRPFYLKYPDEMLKTTKRWSKHSNYHVRRLASEGCRPRLPWAMALPYLKEDPTSILEILDTLKSDKEEYVRRSVANNMNDISKDHPDVAIELASKWFAKSTETDKLVKHGLRTLLKAGDSRALAFFGYGDVNLLKLQNFKVKATKIKVGESLEFEFGIQNTSSKSMLVRIEYAIYYLKANGTHAKKVFKISEKDIEAKSISTLERKQSFKPITTRTFYNGEHKVSVILNGKEMDQKSFVLDGVLT